MTMFPRRSRMSGRDVAKARIAIISEDTVMSKPVCLYSQSCSEHALMTLPPADVL